jgi:hypothetical protein
MACFLGGKETVNYILCRTFYFVESVKKKLSKNGSGRNSRKSSRIINDGICLLFNLFIYYFMMGHGD